MTSTPNRWHAGDRVRVAQSYHWAKGATGTIARPVEEVSPERLAGNFRSGSRQVEAAKGKVRFYWVIFDEPQWDSEGDGPYQEAEIAEEFLEDH